MRSGLETYLHSLQGLQREDVLGFQGDQEDNDQEGRALIKERMEAWQGSSFFFDTGFGSPVQ